MRLGVLDVGSNTVHFLVVDAHRGARPLPAFSHKAELRLADHIEDGNRLTATGERQLRAFVGEALRIAEDKGVEDLLPFATSAVRDAVNGEEILARIRNDVRVDIRVLTGQDESGLTFLAARRWFGWSSGRLLVLDIGGGSLEIASGIDEEPDVAISLPLGAGSTGPGCPATRRRRSRCGRCASMSGPRSRGPRARCCATGAPTTRSRPRRRSGSWPGSPARRRPPRETTCGGISGTRT